MGSRMFLFLFPCSLRIVPPPYILIFVARDSRQKRITRQKKCSKSLVTQKEGECCGMMTWMWISSRLRALLASSFCERINSCTNQVVTLGNTLLGDGEMEKLMMCRMNRDFIVFMRKHYPHVTNEQFEFGTILTVEDNEEDEDE